MNEKIIFYLSAIAIFIFGAIYFGTSCVDRQGSNGDRDAVINSQNLNSELQRTNQRIQIEVRTSIDRLGTAEEELNRAEESIRKCESILERARARAQETTEKP